MHLVEFHLALAALLLAVSLSQASAEPVQRAEEQDWGKTADGATVKLVTLRNARGMSAKIMTLGAIMTEIRVPDRNGQAVSVILGGSSFEEYKKGFPASAAVIGRVANRIANARFALDGVTYTLAKNNGPNHLHGGNKGFSQVIWTARPPSSTEHSASVELSYFCKDGEEGYPGNLNVKVTYSLNDDNELSLTYEATTDKATPVNFTNHAYFNLAGTGVCHDQELWINSDRYTPADDTLIPTGEIKPVKGTPLDFTTMTRIGDRIDKFLPQINGYDHNFVLDGDGKKLVLAARAKDPKSGRTMEVRTTEPAVQLYTGNHVGHRGFCLETQHYPDSINHPAFPSTVLRPGEHFRSETVFAFSAQ
jgi:aldose 1-epimerase